jgi:Mn-dependent DtxR family transcriptional regulator
MLADLIAVRRPSATAALSELARDGLVQRDGAGLLLHGDVLEAIDHLLDERVT